MDTGLSYEQARDRVRMALQQSGTDVSHMENFPPDGITRSEQELLQGRGVLQRPAPQPAEIAPDEQALLQDRGALQRVEQSGPVADTMPDMPQEPVSEAPLTLQGAQQKYGQKHADAGVTPAFLAAIAQVESSGGVNTTGPETKAGRALGPYQITPKWQSEYAGKAELEGISAGAFDPHNPEHSTAGVARWFADQSRLLQSQGMSQKEALDEALRRYQGGYDESNRGPNNAAYVKKVRKAQSELGEETDLAAAAATGGQTMGPERPPAGTEGTVTNLGRLGPVDPTYQSDAPFALPGAPERPQTPADPFLKMLAERNKGINDRAREYAREAGAAKGDADRLMSLMETQQGAFRDAKVKPGRVFKDASNAKNALRVIGALMGAIAEGLSMGKIQNKALDAIDEAIDRDIKLQLEEIRQKGRSVDMTRNLLAHQWRKLGDLRAAYLNTERIMSDAFAQNAAALASQMKGTELSESDRKELRKMSEDFQNWANTAQMIEDAERAALQGADNAMLNSLVAKWPWSTKSVDKGFAHALAQQFASLHNKGTLTEKDVEPYRQTTPAPGDTPQQIARKMQRLRRRLELDKQKIAAKYPLLYPQYGASILQRISQPQPQLRAGGKKVANIR